MLIDRRTLRNFDYLSFLTTIALLATGLLFVYSATYTPNTSSLFFNKQLFGCCSGLIIYGVIALTDPQRLLRIGFIGYFCTLALLLYTIGSGWLAMGARRWVSLYVLRIQPSELAKLFLPACFAYYWSNQEARKKFLVPVLVLASTTMLVLKQPDLGTALAILCTGLLLLWHAQLPRKFFFVALLTAGLCAPLGWRLLHHYQKQRILVLFGQGNSHGSRYQIEQAIIAIGSGQLRGNGFLQGTMNKLAYIPEDHTDFIFAVIAEEWGFLGGLWVIGLFTFLFGRLLCIIAQLDNQLDQTVALGLLGHIIFSAIVNMGMVLGLLPIVGIPLPLCSYGISNLWVTLASLGWIQSILMRRAA